MLKTIELIYVYVKKIGLLQYYNCFIFGEQKLLSQGDEITDDFPIVLS